MKRKVNDVSTELNLYKKNKRNVYDDNLIQLYLIAIDNQNKSEVEILCKINNENNNENDIVYEMYIENQLNFERFQFILENCTSYLTISSSLIKKLMKNNNKELL